MKDPMDPAGQHFIASVYSAHGTHSQKLDRKNFLFPGKINFSVIILLLFPVSRLASGGLDYQKDLEAEGQPGALLDTSAAQHSCKSPLLANHQLARPAQRMS